MIRSVILATCFVLVVAAFTYSRVSTQTAERLFVIHKDGKAGFVDRTGKIVVQPQYESAENSSDGLAQVTTVIREGSDHVPRIGFIDSSGKLVIKPQFLQAYNFSEGLALAKNEKGLYGFIDRKGRWAIKPRFDDALGSGFSEGMAAVCANGNWGFVDKTGFAVVPLQYSFAGEFSEGLGSIGRRRKAGYVDKLGKVVIPPQFDMASPFSEGLACVKVGAKFGFINKSGEFEIKAIYASAYDFSEGLARASPDAVNFGFIDRGGKFIIPPQYDALSGEFSEGLAPVCKDRACGYIDKTGKIVIDFKFTLAAPFSNGVAAVLTRDGEGLIDRLGNYIWQSRL